MCGVGGDQETDDDACGRDGGYLRQNLTSERRAALEFPVDIKDLFYLFDLAMCLLVGRDGELLHLLIDNVGQLCGEE